MRKSTSSQQLEQDSVDLTSFNSISVDDTGITKTPQEWHKEHIEFMKSYAHLYSQIDEAEELEAVAYFDQANIRMVFCCTHCMAMLAPFKQNHIRICPECNTKQTGGQSCRAAYLALVGIRHPQCQLSDSDFNKNTHNLKPLEFVQKYLDFIEQHTQKSYIAERRALKLMKHLFGERVYQQIVNNGETWVTGADGMYYRLFWSRHGNVAVYEHRYKTHANKAGKTWTPLAAYCGHFGEDYPISDQIIAQICMIKTNPDRYISQANKVNDEHLSYCGPEFLHKTMMEKIMAVQL